MSRWQDSNLRPPAPKAGALTGLRYTSKLFKEQIRNHANSNLRPSRVKPTRDALPILRYTSSPNLYSQKKGEDRLFSSSGEGGIRTLGTRLEYGSLANYWFKPLTHLTKMSGKDSNFPEFNEFPSEEIEIL